MASAKIATLVIRTLAKPISAQIKHQALQHEPFRKLCMNLAQGMYRTEVRLRTNILGEPAIQHIRPLSETRAIENGANALAEGFLFTVALGLIAAETWRSSRSQSKRRVLVDDQLEDLNVALVELENKLDVTNATWEAELQAERARSNEMARILNEALDIQARAAKGWRDLHASSQLATLRQQSEELAPPKPPPTPSNTQSNNTQSSSATNS
ncbi:OPA3-domain-containing protein [Pluteus cervinus]|uniref:OPA3-domain-containing protein n=1 Tax=Pluteus cervinus TaxID=181527 RepID=A0ACD3AIV9_9AGAR|nr:OPA3-domain-containing protein [Pluteus cervinus]